jgi:beta-propeller repeat-containing protein
MKTKSTSQPVRRSLGEGGFFNLRASIAPVVAFAGVFLALFATAMRPPGPVTQAWVARYNGSANGLDDAKAIAVDGSGNVYVTGFSLGAGTFNDYATVKYDSAGQEQWVARYNGPGNGEDDAVAIATDGAGNLYVTGQSLGLGTDYDYATVKYDSAGQEQWVARYNGPGNGEDDAVAIATDGAGNLYVTGQSLGAGTSSDYATIKYDSAGLEQWVARYNGPVNGFDIASAIAIDSLGNVYVTGRSSGAGTSADYATVKYDSAGQEQWVARYNGPGNGPDEAYAIAVDSLGNVCVTGATLGSGPGRDYATIKYNAAGEEQWVARYPLSLASAIAVDGSGNVYVTGESSETVSGPVDYATIKYNSSGQEQWVARYNGSRNGYNRAQAIALDGSGNVYVTGFSTGTRTYDYATVKYDSAGQEQWVARYNGPGHSDDRADAMAVDSTGNVYVTGGSDGRRTGYDYATVKYVQNPP